MSEPLLNVMKIMLLAGLYLFFVRVLWSVYDELRDPRTRVSRRRGSQAAPAFVPASGFDHVAHVAHGAHVAQLGQLSVLEPPGMAGLVWELGPEITIGRSPTCGVHIDDTYISGVHARIFNRNGTFMVEDLASRNGSLLNSQPLTATTALGPGDRLQVGATIMEFS